jgi:hypothetical protein
MLTAFAFVLFLSGAPRESMFPIVVSLFTVWFLLFVILAARKRKMEKAGTWMGFGSISCEDRWNGSKGKKREGMLLAAGIGTDDPEHAVLLDLKWDELPAERRRQIFEKSPWGPKAKKTTGK